MLSQTATNSYKTKWLEAERELAVRGVFLPPQTAIDDYFLIPDAPRMPHLEDESNPKDTPTL